MAKGCKFIKPWVGVCGRRVVGRGGNMCKEHHGLKCHNCGKPAVTACGADVGGLCCGAPLCADCTHDPNAGFMQMKHVSKKLASERMRAWFNA